MVDDYEWTKQHETENEKGRVDSPPVKHWVLASRNEPGWNRHEYLNSEYQEIPSLKRDSE